MLLRACDVAFSLCAVSRQWCANKSFSADMNLLLAAGGGEEGGERPRLVLPGSPLLHSV